VTDSQRNFAILVVIAAIGALFFTGEFSLGAGLLNLVLSIVFTALIGLWMWNWHQRNATSISAMKPFDRLVLQGSGIILYANIVGGTLPPFQYAYRAPGTYVFFAILIACIYGLYWSFQRKP
jgi:hypothetical protein